MSIVSDVINFIETGVEAVVPTIAKSPHYYDTDKNPGIVSQYVYTVTPGPGTPTSGVTRYVTIEQEFKLELTKEYTEEMDNDESIRETIEELYQDNEDIIEELSLRKATNILKIGQPYFDTPQVDHNKKTVSIAYTYPITYRKSVKGDS